MSEKRRLAQRLRNLAKELEAEAEVDERRELMAEFGKKFYYFANGDTFFWLYAIYDCSKQFFCQFNSQYRIDDTSTWDASAHGYGKGRWYTEIDGKVFQSDNLEDVAVPLMRNIRSKQ